MGCHLWGHAESDMTEVTQQQQYVLSGEMNEILVQNYCLKTEGNVKGFSLVSSKCTIPMYSIPPNG